MADKSLKTAKLQGGFSFNDSNEPIQISSDLNNIPDTPPSTPRNGNVYFAPLTKELFIRHEGQWVRVQTEESIVQYDLVIGEDSNIVTWNQAAQRLDVNDENYYVTIGIVTLNGTVLRPDDNYEIGGDGNHIEFKDLDITTGDVITVSGINDTDGGAGGSGLEIKPWDSDVAYSRYQTVTYGDRILYWDSDSDSTSADKPYDVAGSPGSVTLRGQNGSVLPIAVSSSRIDGITVKNPNGGGAQGVPQTVTYPGNNANFWSNVAAAISGSAVVSASSNTLTITIDWLDEGVIATSTGGQVSTTTQNSLGIRFSRQNLGPVFAVVNNPGSNRIPASANWKEISKPLTYLSQDTDSNDTAVTFLDLYADGYTQRRVRIGIDAVATGIASIAIGNGAESLEQSSVAIGRYSISNGSSCVAIGVESEAGNEAFGYGSLAIGAEAEAIARTANAIGYRAKIDTDANNATAIGNTVVVNDTDGFAAGGNITLNGKRAIGIGRNLTTKLDDSIVMGADVQNFGEETLAIGQNIWIDSDTQDSVAIGVNVGNVSGFDSEGLGNRATAVGHNTRAAGLESSAYGNSARALGQESTAIGQDAQADSDFATAIGDNTRATALSATALGRAAQATATEALAMGDNSRATARDSVAMGYDCRGQHQYSVAIGYMSETDTERQITLDGTNTHALSLPTSSADPGGMPAGTIYFNSTNARWRGYNGSKWGTFQFDTDS